MANPAPDAGENATPYYGIRWPKPGTKAAQLALRFERIAKDVEGALDAFGLPTVVATNIVTAATSSARDAHWGVPSTAAARRALQETGASTLRTDNGTTERYFANLTDGGANPGGMAVAGWYIVTQFPALVDTPWTNLALSSGWSEATPTEVPQYCRRRGIVYLRGRLSGGTTATGFTLPAGFRPGTIARIAVASGGATTPTLVVINTNGTTALTTATQPNLTGISFVADA